MLGLNNHFEKMKKSSNKNIRYTIKRLAVGVASVAVASVLSFGTVSAEENANNIDVTSVEQLAQTDETEEVSIEDNVISEQGELDNLSQDESSQEINNPQDGVDYGENLIQITTFEDDFVERRRLNKIAQEQLANIPERKPGFYVKEEDFDKYPKTLTLANGVKVTITLSHDGSAKLSEGINLVVHPEGYTPKVMETPKGGIGGSATNKILYERELLKEQENANQEENVETNESQATVEETKEVSENTNKAAVEETNEVFENTNKTAEDTTYEPVNYVLKSEVQQGPPMPENGQVYPIPVGRPGKGNIPEDGLSATVEAGTDSEQVIDPYGYRYIDSGLDVEAFDEKGEKVQNERIFIRQGRDYSLDNQSKQIAALDNSGKIASLKFEKRAEIQRLDNPGEYEPLMERSYSWDLNNYDPEAYYIMNVDGERIKTYDYDPSKHELYDHTSRGFVQVYYPSAFILEKPADGDVFRAEDGEIITAEIIPAENGQILNIVVNKIDRIDGIPRHVRDIRSFLIPNGVDSDTTDDEGNQIPAKPISYIENLVTINKDNFADEALSEMIFNTQIGLSPLYEFESSIRPVQVLQPERSGDDVIYTEYELLDKNLDDNEFTDPNYDTLVEKYNSKDFWELNYRQSSEEDPNAFRQYPNGYRMKVTGVDVLDDKATRVDDGNGNITLDFQKEDGYTYRLSPIEESKTHYTMKTYDSNGEVVNYTNATGKEQDFRYAFIEPNTNQDGIFKSKIYVYLDDYQQILDEDGEVVVMEEEKPEGYLATLPNGKDFYNPPGINGNEIRVETSPTKHYDNDGVLRDGLNYRILTRQISSVDGVWEPMIEFFVPDGLPASNLDVKHRYITREYDVNGNLINYRNSTSYDPTIRKIIGNKYTVSPKPKATYDLDTINGLSEGEFKPRKDEKIEFLYGRKRQQGQVNVEHKFYLVRKNQKGEIVERKLVKTTNESPRVEFDVQDDFVTSNAYEVNALSGDSLPEGYVFVGEEATRSGQFVGGKVVDNEFIYVKEVVVNEPTTPKTPTEKPKIEDREIPTETPTEEPVETPTETPTEAPVETPTETPVEEQVPEETAETIVPVKVKEKQAPEKVADRKLPETGESAGSIVLPAVLVLAGLGFLFPRKKKED